MNRLENVQAVLGAISEAQKGLIKVQSALTSAHPLAAQIPMYDRLGKMVAELRTMMLDAQRLPL